MIDFYFNDYWKNKIYEVASTINANFYYGNALVDLKDNYAAGNRQMLWLKIQLSDWLARAQTEPDHIRFVVKNDGSGNLDYIEINADGENTEGILRQVSSRNDFWGIPIKRINKREALSINIPAVYQFFV